MEQLSIETKREVDPDRLIEALRMRETDIGAAISELELLVEDGSPLAKAALGNIYLYGTHGIPKDERKGEELLADASAMGSIDGAYRLACFYDWKGRHEEAFDLYERLGNEGFSPALYRMAWAYHTGRSVAQNTDKARQLFYSAYKKGHLLAQQKLSYELRRSSNILDKLRGLLMLATLILPRGLQYAREPRSDRLRK